jgi:hypothetical protein
MASVVKSAGRTRRGRSSDRGGDGRGGAGSIDDPDVIGSADALVLGHAITGHAAFR